MRLIEIRLTRAPRLVMALGLLALMASLAMGTAVSAQSSAAIPLPVFTATDRNHVDLLTSTLMRPLTPVAVGIDGAGLSEHMLWTNSVASYSNVAFENFGYIRYSGQFINALGVIGAPAPNYDAYTVSIGRSSENFFLEGGLFVPQIADGSSLTRSGATYTYKMRDGSIAIFVGPPISLPNSTLNINIAFLTQLENPDGEIKTYNYSAPPATNYSPNLVSVNSNYGYQINYNGWGSVPGGASNANLGVMATNLAVSYCSPNAFTCASAGVSWPVANFAPGPIANPNATNPTYPTLFSDALGNVTTLNIGPSGIPQQVAGAGSGGVGYDLTSVIRPNDAAAGSDVTIGYTTITGVGSLVASFSPCSSEGCGPIYGGEVDTGSGRLGIASVTDAAGTWTYAYGVTQASGANQSIQMTVTDPMGHQRLVDSTFSLGQIASDTDADGNQTQYQYDSNYRLTAVIHPSGLTDQYTYDNRGNVLSHGMLPSGSSVATIVERAVYPTACTNSVTCNEPTSVTDANGNETDYTYDPTTGLVLTKTLPAGPNGVRPQTRYYYQQISAYYYNASGVMASGAPIWKLEYTSTCQTQTSCAGTSDEIRVIYTYDGNLRPTVIKTEAGDGTLVTTVTNTYDAIGNLTSVTKPMGSANTLTTTVYLYDADRRKIGEIGPAPTGNGHYRATRTTYDKDGNVTLTETGWTTSQSDTTLANFVSLEQHASAYDAIDRKVQEATSANGVVSAVAQYTYDGASRTVCVAQRMNSANFGSAPNGPTPVAACNLSNGVYTANLQTAGVYGPDRVTYNTYDAASELLTTVKGFGTSNQITDQTLTYTIDSLVATQADANGNLTTNTYDGLDRLSKTAYPNPAGGGTSSTTDYEQFTYDAASNIITDRRRDGQVNTKTYDALERLVSATLPVATTYAHDNLGRLTSATQGAQSLTYSYDAFGRQTGELATYGQFSFQYDLAGDLTQITWPDGFYVTYAYDTDGEPTAIAENGATSGAGVLARYSYNDLGLRTQVARGNGVTTAYGYDTAWRLNALSQCLPSNPQPCAAGNANYENETLSNYNPAGQLITHGVSNPAFNYAPTSTTTSYTVNGQNQVVTAGANKYAYDGRGNLSSDGVNAYGYDADNNLISFNGSATLSTDPAGRLMEVTDLSGGTATTASRWFRYDGPNLLAEYGAVGSDAGVPHRRYVPGPETDEVVVWYDSADTTMRRWLLTDHQGSVTAVTDAGANVLAVNTYDEYGVPGAGNLGRFQYTGQIWIPEVGLYHYKARDYSPTLGRFMQTDPVGYKDGLNWYEYVGDDPVNGTDPTGQSGWLSDLWNAITNVFNPPAPSPSPQAPKPDEIVVTAKRPAPSGSNILSGVVVVAGKIARQSSATIRRAWERATGGTWPKDPATGRNQDVSHIKARADGGDDSPGNVKPQPHDEHMKDHMENGDFKRWGARSSGGRGSPEASPPPEPEGIGQALGRAILTEERAETMDPDDPD